MPSRADLERLIETWREVGRHLTIDESMTRLAEILTSTVAASRLAIRRIDLKRLLIETVATTDRGAEPIAPPRQELRGQELEELLAWLNEDRILRLRPGVPPRVAALSTTADEEILVGPLVSENEPLGILVLAATNGASFSEREIERVRSLLEPLAVALRNDSRIRELQTLRESAEADNRTLLSKLGRSEASEIIGAQTGLRAVMERVELVAASDVPVLIFGETGSGKEVIARAIHTGSRRARGPFLRVNCGAIPPDLIDSELFGHERGSFTGAVGERKGWFERADGGTLFLDECGELPAAAQVRLLRILQDGAFERVGGEAQISVDVRVVAATHRDLRQMISDRTFREDLWYRLAVFPIHLPALRERAEDIGEMATSFALRAAKRFGLAPCVPSPEDTRQLANYPWPGNVRELRAVIERAVILGDGRKLEVSKALGSDFPRVEARHDARPPIASPSVALPPVALSTPVATPSETALELDQAMARHIERALATAHGRVEGPFGAAKALGVNPNTLRARMRKLGVDPRRFRRASE